MASDKSKFQTFRLGEVAKLEPDLTGPEKVMFRYRTVPDQELSGYFVPAST